MPGVLQHLDILSPWAPAVTGALALITVSAAAWSRRRVAPWAGPRRVGPAVAMPLAAVIVVVAALLAVNLHFEYLPTLGDAFGYAQWPTASLSAVSLTAPRHDARARDAVFRRAYASGVVVSLPIAGVRSGFGRRTALVYLPPQYFTATRDRFPVAYLLHGMPGAPVDWFRAGDAARAGLALANAGRPMILVAPRLSRSWLSDSECVNGTEGNVKTYLASDVVAAVDQTFRTEAAGSGRLLVGISAGGYCALNVGLQHQATFGSIVDLSGLDRPTHTHGARGLYGAGRDTGNRLTADSPLRYLPTLRISPTERVYLGCGRADTDPLHDAHLVDRALSSRNVPVTFVVSSGSHTYNYWRRALPAALAWWNPPETEFL